MRTFRSVNFILAKFISSALQFMSEGDQFLCFSHTSSGAGILLIGMEIRSAEETVCWYMLCFISHVVLMSTCKFNDIGSFTHMTSSSHPPKRT